MQNVYKGRKEGRRGDGCENYKRDKDRWTGVLADRVRE